MRACGTLAWSACDERSHPYRPYAPGTQPPYDVPGYRGTSRRHPTHALHPLPPTITETTGPSFSPKHYPPSVDLTVNTTGKAALGERIIVAGTITDENGRPVPHTMVEIWQCNATGRYDHPADQHDAPLDPNFHGQGRVFTDANGRYRFTDHTARRLSVAEPQERLAAEPHPFLVFRAGVRDAADHPDVFPGRSAAGARPDLQRRAGRSTRATG